MIRRRPEPIKDVLTAFRDVCRGHVAGIEDLAARIGRQPRVLENKCNPESEHHTPTLTDAAQVTQVTGDPQIVEALAHLANGVFVPLPKLGTHEEDQVLILMANWCAENEKWLRKFAAFKADGKLSPREQDELREQATKIQQKLLTLMHGVGQ